MPDNHTQRISDIREAVELDMSYTAEKGGSQPSGIYRSHLACLAADLEHLAEHEAAEAEYMGKLAGGFPSPPGAEALAQMRRHTERIARLLGLAQGGENASQG